MNDLLNYKILYLLFFLMGFFLGTIISFGLLKNNCENNDPSDWWKKGKDPFEYDE